MRIIWYRDNIQRLIINFVTADINKNKDQKALDI